MGLLTRFTPPLFDMIKPNGDGFIARVGGVEYAIVGVCGDLLIPCFLLHPNVSPINYRLATIRKGLV